MKWTNPLVKVSRVTGPMGEVTPFVFKGKLYRIENWPKYFDLPGAAPDTRFMEDALRIWNIEDNKLVSKFMVGYSFGYVFMWENRIYVFAARHNPNAPWRYYTEIDMTYSDDLVNWSTPQQVIKSEAGEHLFNTAVCWDGKRFVLLYETDDSRWPAFTFKYCTSKDLVHWRRVPGAMYGKEKYVGGPALYFEGGYYYTLYLQDLFGAWETRVTRSRDLVHWENAPDDRPFLTYDRDYVWHDDLRNIDIPEVNASDAELVYYKGKTIVYFGGGDQQHWGDSQRAEFKGTPQELLESYFKEPADVVLRSKRQVKYQENQLGAFVHFGTPAFIGDNPAEYVPDCIKQSPGFPYEAWGLMVGTPPASKFNPTQLDANQWARTAKAMGAKHMVFTSKHHSGFCMWPTKTTDYSVKSSPWKDGKGDVLKEFVQAARKEGLQPGFYISSGDASQGCLSTIDRKLIGDREAYFKVFKEQLTEILTGYGKLAVIWMDGALDPFGADVIDHDGKPTGPKYQDEIARLIRKYQPDAVIFGGTQCDVTWTGNELGIAEYPQWNVLPNANSWQIPESCVFIRNTWFWTPNSEETIFPTSKLVDIYHTSIARGANLLMNMTPNNKGLISDAEVKAITGMGEEIARLYGKPIARMSSKAKWAEDHCLELDLKSEHKISAVLLEEDLNFGQRVKRYQLDALQNNHWVPLAITGGKSIGRKRIDRFDPVTTAKVRLKILESIPLPKIRTFEVF